MHILFDIRDNDGPAVAGKQLCELAKFALRFMKVDDACELSISLVSPEEMQELNHKWRDINTPTDVLSFECDSAWDTTRRPGQLFALGDVVVCTKLIDEQRRAFGTSFEEELSLMLIHSILHLLGYDHATAKQARKMQAIEHQILEAYAQEFDGSQSILTANNETSGAKTAPFRSGFVTLIGRPNAGKSTLINTVMGKKLSITSNTAQTTRHRIRAIYNDDKMQMIMVDTPGFHKPHNLLGTKLNESALYALNDTDIACMLIDASKPVGKGDARIAHTLSRCRAKKILLITKIDLAKSKDEVLRQLDCASQLCDFDNTLALCAKTGFNIDEFKHAVYDFLPSGPRLFPQNMSSDQALDTLIAEFIREKILRCTHEELPHAVHVSVQEISRDERTGFTRIQAFIYVERKSQKAIVIGHAGQRIKRIGKAARLDLERELACHVYLDLHVEVKKNWRDDADEIRNFGYAERL